MKALTRKHLHLPGLLERSRAGFKKITDPLEGKTQYPLVNCFMSGLALFGLKYPSLLQFDENSHGVKRIQHNLKMLYGIDPVPSDTYFRERLDPVEPEQLQQIINRIIAQLQRAKVLEQFRYLDDYYVLSLDGTGYFSSPDIYCESCCIKRHRDGTVTYYHQMLAAVLVHPLLKTVFPFAIEPIIKKDGSRKNDCEHNAAKRLLRNIRRFHPHLKLLVTLDGLYADHSIIQLLQELDIRFIITAKPRDLKYLYEFYQASKKQVLEEQEEWKDRRYEWVNHLPLNDVHADCEVNLLCYQEQVCYKKKAKIKDLRFSWITDINLTNKTIQPIMKGGRARWRIENETFNTLKNQGYQFEHNFGHGDVHLSVVMAYLMFTAFLIDQVQEYCCRYFKAALRRQHKLRWLWERIRGLFLYYYVDSWADFYTVIIDDKAAHIRDLIEDTS